MSSANAADYKADVLKLPSRITSSVARSINNKGQFVGVLYDINGNSFACKWDSTPSHTVTYLYNSFDDTEAYDINDNGEVVGIIGYHACKWDAKNNITTLPALGNNYAAAFAINSNGQIVGCSEIDMKNRACIWDKQGVHQLAVSSVNNSTWACDINSSGTIVGYEGGSMYHASVWDADGIHDKSFGYESSVIHAINELGVMVGSTDGGACMWDAAGIHILPDLNPGYLSAALGINNNGQIVGVSGNVYSGEHACLWDENGVHDLGSLTGYTGDSFAYSINDLGQIVGSVTTGTNRGQAVIWNPVPEPSSIFALISGISCLGGVVLRKKR